MSVKAAETTPNLPDHAGETAGDSVAGNDIDRHSSRLTRLLSHTSHAELPDGSAAEALAGPPPDGGLDAWLCVVGGLFQQFCIFGLMGANGVLQNYYLEHQLRGYSKSTVAWLGSIQTLVEFSFALVMGRYFDVHGARLLVVGASFLSFASIIGMAFSYKFYHFLLSFILFGFAGSFIYGPSAAVASHWFDRRRGLAVGIVACGSGLGGVLYPIILDQLFKKLSYRDTMLIVGGMNFVLMLPGAVLVKTRLPPHRPPPWSDMKRPWKDTRYTFHVIGAMLFGMNILAPFFTAIDYATANHVPKHIADYSVTISLSGSIAGRLVFGALADAFGVWHVFGWVGFSASVVMFALWTPTVGTGGVIVGLIGYGMLSGAWFALVPAATATISPVREIGMRFGMLISSLSVPSLIGPVVTSALISAGHDSYKWAGVWMGCIFFLSGIFVNFLPAWGALQRRRKGIPVDHDVCDAAAAAYDHHPDGGTATQEPTTVEK